MHDICLFYITRAFTLLYASSQMAYEAYKILSLNK